MARSVHNDVLDALLTELATCNKICVCSQAVTTHAEAFTTYMLAATALTPGDTNFLTIGEGDADGRKAAVAAVADIYISNTGTATHIALLDAANVQFVTTCTDQALTEAGTVTVPTFDVEARDPSAPA